MVVTFFHAPFTTEVYTLSLHDALPIFGDDADGRAGPTGEALPGHGHPGGTDDHHDGPADDLEHRRPRDAARDRKSTRLNSSHGYISYAVFCLKKKRHTPTRAAGGPSTV